MFVDQDADNGLDFVKWKKSKTLGRQLTCEKSVR